VPHLRWWGRTHPGKVRKNNEDAFLGVRFDAQDVNLLGMFGQAGLETRDYVFAVSDGMGGASAGEFASRITVDKITELLPPTFQRSASGLRRGFSDVLDELFTEVHRALVYLGGSYDECRGMGATLTLCWFTPEWLYWAHVGDSRLYYFPVGGGIKQVTQDDTHVAWLLREGKISSYEARNHPMKNSLQRALGAGNQFVDPHFGRIGYEPGDRFLICSDGIWDQMFENDLLRVLGGSDLEGDPSEVLTLAANRAGGKDNATAVVVEVLPHPEEAHSERLC